MTSFFSPRSRPLLFLTALAVLAHQGLARPALDVRYQFGQASDDPGTDSKGKLLEGYDGAFYGTAFNSGSGFSGYGCIYRITAQGDEGTIFTFNGNNGDAPVGGLTLSSDGYTMYGTANGGANNGVGTFYSVTPTGSLGLLFTFPADRSYGASPNGNLVLGPDGQTFYGTTQFGGQNDNGVVFSATVDGAVHVIHTFSAMVNGVNADGALPKDGLTLGDDGFLYGMASQGGSAGNGVVFRMSTDGSTFNTLHSFSALDTNGRNSDGSAPSGQLVKGRHGIFYGVGTAGGKYGFGTLFKITSAGVGDTLHHFKGGNDGAFPQAVNLDPEGALCGVTEGGADAGGSVFVLYANRRYTSFSFPGGDVGEGLETGLGLGSDGNFYGTTVANGVYDQGTFFEVGLSRKTILEFSTAAGTYKGNLNDGSGPVRIILEANGKLSGYAEVNKHKFTFKGSLDATTESFTTTLKGTGGNLSLQLNYGDENGFEIDGNLNGVTVTAIR